MTGAQDHAPPLGLLAGGGPVPPLIASHCRASGRALHVVVIEGQGAPEAFGAFPHDIVRLGAAGRMIDAFRRAGVEELVFAGVVRRPSLKDLRPDFWAAKFLARTGAFALGDDGLFKAILEAIETREGFRVLAPHVVLPNLLAEKGALGTVTPSEAAWADIRAAARAALGLGAEDKGQAAVAAQGQVVALEGEPGTRAMLDTLAGGTAKGGVLAKMAKPGQEQRVDLPTIGSDTVSQAARAGLIGIAVEAGRSQIIDKPAVAAAADAAGLFVVGIEPGE